LRYHSAFLIILLLPLSFSSPSFGIMPTQVQAQTQPLAPFAPHEYKVLIVTAGRDSSGYGTLYAELARYGFNLTFFECGTGNVDFLTNPKTKNINQYDIVILHGSMTSAYSPMRMTSAEIQHFTRGFSGILVSIGFSMFINETSGTEWHWSEAPMTYLEERFGVDFTGVIPPDPNYGNTRNGTLTKTSSIIIGLDNTLTYKIPKAEFTRQLRGTITNATQLYKFTWDSTDELGITYYKNATGAVGILINNQWVYGVDIAQNEFRWWGIENNGTKTYDTGLSKRANLIGRIIAYALDKDFDVRIKPQPLLNIRLDDIGASGVPSMPGWAIDNFDSKALTCIQNFANALSSLNIEYATIAGLYSTQAAPQWFNGTRWLSFTDSTWQETRNFMLSKNATWEYANHIDHQGSTATFLTASTEQHQQWMQNTINNMTLWDFNKASVVMNPRGDWGQNQWTALTNLGYYSAVTPLDSYFDDIFGPWAAVNDTNVGHALIKNSVIVHPSENGFGARKTPYFQNASKNTIWMSFAATYNDHPQILASMTEDVGSIFNHYENFYANEVGTWWLNTWVWNMTYEIPDLKFVKFEEGIQYFAKRNATITELAKTGDTLSFTVNVDNAASLPGIGKGMLWYNINSGNSTIQAVKIDGRDWHVFDEHSIRIPAQNSHIEILFGNPQTPYIRETDREITLTHYGGTKLEFMIYSLSGTFSRTKVYAGDKGKPIEVSGTSNWSYDESTKTVTINILHSNDQQEVIVRWIEHNPPITTLTLKGSQGTNNWFTSNVTATLSAADDSSGVEKIEYSFDNNTWLTYSNPFRITTEGSNPVYYRAFDKDGNIETAKLQVINIDKTCPSDSIRINEGATYTSSTAVTLSLTSTDKTSGVSQVRYSNDGNWDTELWETPASAKAWFIPGGDGTKTIYFQIIDRAGLISETSDTIILDTTPPFAEAGANQTVNEDTQVTLDGSNSTDNFIIVNYNWTFAENGNAQKFNTKVATYTFETPGIYLVTLNLTDAAGNWATGTTMITVLDVTKPIAYAGTDRTAEADEMIIFNASGSSDNVGIVGYEWDFGDGETDSGMIVSHAYFQAGIYNVTLTVRDAANNVASSSITATIQLGNVEETGTPFQAFWILGIIILIGTALALASLLLKRRK
jgi:hypothetical protein